MSPVTIGALSERELSMSTGKQPFAIVVTLLLVVSASAPTSANVSLSFQPAELTSHVGAVFSIDLVAVADGSAPEDIGAIDAILAWNPDYLELIGFTPNAAGWYDQGFFPNPDGLNNGVNPNYPAVPANDGDVMYTAFANPSGSPRVSAPPVPGTLIVTTFRFRALAESPGTGVSLISQFGNSRTQVFALTPPGFVITGDISGSVSVEIESGSALLLEVAGECLGGEIVTVELWMRDLVQNATGYETYLEYDYTKLAYRGDLSAYTNLPFPVHFTAIEDAEVSTGWLDLDGGVTITYPPNEGTNEDARLAYLRFEVLSAGECNTTQIAFRDVGSIHSGLAYAGDPIPTELIDSQLFMLDSQPPVISGCPENIVVANDEGVCAAVVSWTPPTAEDNCGGDKIGRAHV